MSTRNIHKRTVFIAIIIIIIITLKWWLDDASVMYLLQISKNTSLILQLLTQDQWAKMHSNKIYDEKRFQKDNHCRHWNRPVNVQFVRTALPRHYTLHLTAALFAWQAEALLINLSIQQKMSSLICALCHPCRQQMSLVSAACDVSGCRPIAWRRQHRAHSCVKLSSRVAGQSGITWPLLVFTHHIWRRDALWKTAILSLIMSICGVTDQMNKAGNSKGDADFRFNDHTRYEKRFLYDHCWILFYMAAWEYCCILSTNPSKIAKYF